MSGTTSVPRVSFTDLGFVAPLESAIVTGLNADYDAAFGGGLNTDAATPAGQLIAATAAMLGDANDQEVALFNSVDPANASGRMQDAIARIYYLERNPAQSTVLQIVCGGGVGVVIPAGAQVVDGNNMIYVCTALSVIGVGGTVNAPFAALVSGPLAVPLTVAIYQVIPGWDTAVVSSGIVGNAVESRASFEAHRAASVAANGAGFLPAIAGAVSKVPGVIDYYVTENYTGAPVTVGGVSLAAHSLYVCVAGGASAAIARAIWTKKNPGCGYTGNISVVVEDSNSGYSPPFPVYTVTYQVPTAAPICFLVKISTGPAVPATAATLIQNAIIRAFNGEDGGTRARIGSAVYASRFYSAVASLGFWAQIVTIQIGTGAVPGATFTGSIAGSTLTVSSVTGTIVIGQFVFGLAVAPGTIITAGSGASWTVAVSQTVASEAMVSTAAAQNEITININQIPTLAALDVSVVLV